MTQTRLPLAGLALGIAMATALPAAAQDRSTHFDGPYIQAFGGYAARSNDGGSTLVFDRDGDGSYNDPVTLTGTGADAFSPGFCNGRALGATPAAGCYSDIGGAEYGLRVGYDKRMNNFVLGGLVEVSKNEAVDGTSGFSTTPAAYAFERELDYNVSARLRAGYTPGGGMLFYATGGASFAKIDHAFGTTNTANSFTERRDKKGVWGWQAGGGGELMLTDNLSLGLEYLYNRYDDDKYNVLVGPGTAPATNPFIAGGTTTRIRPSDTRFDYHSLRATVGFHF